ncbi:hypothetical protein BD289DRAFT_434948 [Coniella lustricola]|uniref:Rhodopsin domain-containing protein n=1 Tax=Coniella lustricola TaxID=2025994 RepID=A0A2T3A6Y5_9PEZI|nr:hypothetical protein BD289DRAFT_434948 [Coniella lustricola]
MQCSPAYILWSADRPAEYTCIKQVLFFRITGIINLALDVVLLLTPLPVIWSLRIPKRSKVALSGIFSIGLVSVAAEIARIVIWFETDDGNRESLDSRWNRVDIVDWSCIEYTTAVICASLPHLKALVSIIIPGYFDSTAGSSNNRSRQTRFSTNKLQSSRSNVYGQTKNSTRHSQHPLAYDGSGVKYGNSVSIFGTGGISSAIGCTNESEEHILETMDSDGAWKKADPTKDLAPALGHLKQDI